MGPLKFMAPGADEADDQVDPVTEPEAEREPALALAAPVGLFETPLAKPAPAPSAAEAPTVAPTLPRLREYRPTDGDAE